MTILRGLKGYKIAMYVSEFFGCFLLYYVSIPSILN